MIDVVAVHHRTHELLNDVRVFVGALGRGKCAKCATMFDQFVGDQIQRLVPGGLFELAIATARTSAAPEAHPHIGSVPAGPHKVDRLPELGGGSPTALQNRTHPDPLVSVLPRFPDRPHQSIPQTFPESPPASGSSE